MLNFTKEAMLQVITTLNDNLDALDAKEIIEFEVLNPDFCTSTYAGNIVLLDDKEYVYRGYKAWIDLAQILHCKMLTPFIESSNTVTIRYEKLNSDDSFHKSIVDKEEKYGTESIFSQIYKNEEPAFISHYVKALQNTNYKIIGINSEVLGTGLYATPKSYLGFYANDKKFIDRL